MMAYVVSEGRFFALKPSEWGMLLIGVALCGFAALFSDPSVCGAGRLGVPVALGLRGTGPQSARGHAETVGPRYAI